MKTAVRLLTEDHAYCAGEPLRFFVHPPSAPATDFRLVRVGDAEVLRGEASAALLNHPRGLPPGRYRATYRVAEGADVTERSWSSWSSPCEIVVHDERSSAPLEEERRRAHLLSLMCDVDFSGTSILTDTGWMPPACDLTLAPQWFRTPAYEGRTPLLNEEAPYYADPLAHLVDVMQSARQSGRRFVTWDDVLDDPGVLREDALLVQLDVDGGIHSLVRVIPALMEIGVRATIMLHRHSSSWYTYELADQPIDLFRLAADSGWALGYHQNALSNHVGTDRLPTYSDAELRAAAALAGEDARILESLLPIRTITAHGGNAHNHRVPLPRDLALVDVDRGHHPAWSAIRSSFSDGGLLVRPQPLRTHVASLGRGTHFIRLHPFKYGNYGADERAPRDLPRSASPIEWQKQERWIEQRERTRTIERFTRMSPRRPLSPHFAPWADLEARIDSLRERRGATFLREYPAAAGDPRVFWWRLIEAFAPRRGRVLNVGALPPDRRDENTAFVAPGVEVVELDVDATRSPDILGDICEPGLVRARSFDGVLLYGLPYFPSPGVTVRACVNATAEGGIGLFGFPDETHPLRGALWNDRARPIWDRRHEPLRDVGLRGNLWCFAERSIRDLFDGWSKLEYENFCHYWFVRAEAP